MRYSLVLTTLLAWIVVGRSAIAEGEDVDRSWARFTRTEMAATRPSAPEGAIRRVPRARWIETPEGSRENADSTAADTADDLAMQLQNPLAALISIPIQANLDEGFGPGGTGYQWTINVQPVVPIELDRRWNLISRTVMPVVVREGFLPETSDTVGFGDFVQSLFLSPKKAEPFVWGVGPVLLLPTATEEELGSRKWGLGPTGIVLRQAGPWTYGLYANHIWSFVDARSRSNTLVDPEVNATFLQPFLSYTFPSAFSLSLSAETIYDWESDLWSVPINLTCAQVTTLCRQPLSIGLGFRYWAETPRYGPEWGVRLQVTFLFPRK